jgi:Flp pilus assembly protein TadD
MREHSGENRAARASLKDLLLQKDIQLPDPEGWGIRPDENQERIWQLEAENQSLLHELAQTKKRAEDWAGSVRTTLTDSLFQQGVDAFKSENFMDAMGLFQAVLSLEPGHVRAMINLGVVQAELGYADSAAQTLKRVIELEPDNETAKRNLIILEKGEDE